jgi:glycerol kinase
VNYWSDIKEIKQQWQVDRTFTPQIPESEILSLIRGWHRAVNAAKAWADDSEYVAGVLPPNPPKGGLKL